MRRLLLSVTLIMLIPLTASAGGGGGVISPCTGFETGALVVMQDSCFGGTAHFAPSDTVITVVNEGQLPHSFTAVDGSFDSGVLQAGEIFEFSVDEPGTYRVFCSLHGNAAGQGMAGALLVGDAIPPPVNAEVDTTAIRDAVSAGNEEILAALDQQVVALGNLSAAQASLRKGIDEMTTQAADVEAAAPIPVTPAPQNDETPWVPLTAGLAAGLSLALVAMLRRRRGQDVSEPAVDAFTRMSA